MKKQHLRSALMACAAPVAIGLGVVATPAWAQTNADPETGQTQASSGPVEAQAPVASANGDNDGAQTTGEVVVTGSRIPQPNLTSTSPVTVLNSQEIRLQGTTRVENLINSLPQAFAEFGSNDSNGATGTATANLRNLGSNRTLVLVNGRRLLPGDPSVPSPDLNAIPAALVKRVDVLTGGASSVYGADAVGGVINFIMNTDFTGFRIDGQYSFFNHKNDGNPLGINEALAARGFPNPGGTVADGSTVDMTATIGADFGSGRGHVVAYAGYRKANPVTQDRRRYSACATEARTSAQIATGLAAIRCGGSATSGNGTFFFNDDDGSTVTFQVGAGRNFIPGSTAFNFAPTNYYQRPDERYTGGFFAEYEVSEVFKPYLEGMFMDDRSLAQIAPSGNFGNTFNINCDNPLLSGQQRALVCTPGNLLTLTPDADGNPAPPPLNAAASTVATSPFPGAVPFNFIDPTTGLTYNRGFLQPLRRNVEGGPRIDDLQHTSYRGVIGARGDLSPAISYDAFYQYGRTLFQDTYNNDFSIVRLGRSLDVVSGPNGQPICRSVRDGTDPTCVPYDIFAPGGVTTAAINYLQTPGFQRGTTEEQVAQASITAQLGEYGLQLPWATTGLGLNVGVEYRKESLDLDTDTAFRTGDLAGQGAATLPVSGSFSVREFFTEARLPIVNGGFFHALTLEAGYRYSDYSVGNRGFNTDTYKFAGDFSPIRDIRLRAAYNRAVRSPNIQEFFAPQRVALNGNSDPCSGATPEATAAQCALTGVSAAQYGRITGNPAGQYNGLIGGNADLTPEIADTYTAGVVLQPRFLPRFALTVDYFDIRIENTVSTIGQDTIIQTCIDSADPTFCGLIRRDALGSLWRTSQGFVIDTAQNIGSLKTRGIDVGLSYSMDLGGIGSIALSGNGTYLDQLVTDNGVSDPYDCSGFYGLQCGTPAPKWRHRARATLTTPDGIGFSVQWRYFDPVKIDRSSSNPSLNGAFAPVNRRIGAQSYIDVSLSATVEKNFTMRLGVNNLLDRDPPIIGSNGASGVINACPGTFCNGNTFPNVYDALGRYIFTGVTLDF
jgi:outer membrane receptor protein involved in Fe transport